MEKPMEVKDFEELVVKLANASMEEGDGHLTIPEADELAWKIVGEYRKLYESKKRCIRTAQLNVGKLVSRVLKHEGKEVNKETIKELVESMKKDKGR